MKKIKVLSVNISEQKGTIKHPVPSITLTENGVEGDAHSGSWNRQVSLLGMESIRKFEKEANRKINYGEFAENITTEGLDLWRCQPLDRFVSEGMELEVTQIGKECHGTSCAIFKEVGNCVMPKEGIFARIRDKRYEIRDTRYEQPATSNQQPATNNQRPGTWNLKPETILYYKPKIFSARIITLSDRAFRGEYEDKSGPRVKELLEGLFVSPQSAVRSPQSSVTSHVPRPSSFVPRLSSLVTLLPDDPHQLRTKLQEAIKAGTDFIFTTGGTGIGSRDFTPDVVKSILDKEIPGLMEMIRIKYGTRKHQALLSRSVAGVVSNSLIFTLPGSVKAVNEYMEEITKSLMHMVYMLHGLDTH
ncbi:MAG: molybdenum cofactor synthesis protein [Bacteroidales bacterium]|nr:molybdenum cofactor synthesis protein [Deltaproteobacteria bacterium]MBL7137851.1 molybdenum cofactor synthesis protein [Bacteroidales bacterium]